MSGISLSLYQSTPATRIWAIVPGIREVVVVALVVVALYGRSARIHSSRFQVWKGWIDGRSGRKLPAAYHWLLERWVLVVSTLAGVGVIAWVAMTWVVAHRLVVR